MNSTPEEKEQAAPIETPKLSNGRLHQKLGLAPTPIQRRRAK